MVKSAIPVGLKSMKKNDVKLLAALLGLALVAFLGISLYSQLTTKEPQAVVRLDGKEWGRYPLSEDTVVEIRQTDGNYNRLQIRNETAEIREASCPDKICVNHRPVRAQGESLVCLPNRLVVEIENGEDTGIDAGTK